MMKWIFSRHSLSAYMKERLIKIQKGEVLTLQGKKFSYPATFRLHEAILHLESFEKTQAKKAYAHEINDKWCEQFLVFLMAKNIKKNTVHAIIKQVLMSLRKCCKEHKIPYQVEDFRHSPEITTQIYNSVPEILSINRLVLKGVIQDSRDMYVIQCYTGLRYSDLVTLLRDVSQYLVEENTRKYFRIRTSKTDTVVVIPIAAIVLEILERRKYKIPTKSLQSYNKNIKRIGKMAGITQQVEIFFTRNGLKNRELHPKYELMCSHTARRSFATNAYLAGIPTLKIRQITGHSTEAIFLVYIRADGMESASTIADDPFFQ